MSRVQWSEARVRGLTPLFATLLVTLNAASRHIVALSEPTMQVLALVSYVVVMVWLTGVLLVWVVRRRASLRVVFVGVSSGIFFGLALDALLSETIEPAAVFATAGVVLMGCAVAVSRRVRPPGWATEEETTVAEDEATPMGDAIAPAAVE